MTKRKHNLIEWLMTTYPKIRPAIAIILVAAFSTTSLVKDPSHKIAISTALGVTLLLLFFDIYRSLNKRLDSIDSNLKEQEPPTYSNFSSALPVITEVLEDRLKQNKDVNIKIIAVSAQFTWKLLVEDTLPKLFNIGSKKSKPNINVEFVIVKPEVLNNWGQNRLRISAETTIECQADFRKKHASEFNEKRLEMKLQQYDNIPHWHGVLIDDDELFLGRCSWEIQSNRYYLQIGQREYRHFRLKDRFRGADRIELARNWFDAYNFRAERLKPKKLLTNNKLNEQTEP